MADEDPDTLMQRLRMLPTLGARTQPVLARAVAAPPRKASEFSDHDGFRELRIARAAGKALGIASPYFREVRAVRGAEVQIDGRWVTSFAGYDYLGLNQDNRVIASVAAASATWGISAGASRIAGGERSYHRALEQDIAAFLGVADAVVLVSGHATNAAIIRTLVGPGDLVAVDALAHNSIYEGIRGTGADHLTFPHNDWAWLDARLDAQRSRFKHVLIVVEGIYSMDGDMPDLPRFIEVRNRHAAWLMVDEAHSLGVLGNSGRGICEEQGIDPATVDVLMGTLSKTLCSCGGYVAGSLGLCDLIRYRAPGFLYSVGLSAPNAAAAQAALAALNADPGLVDRLRGLSRYFLRSAAAAGLECGPAMGVAIVPVMIGDSMRATWISNALLAAGFNVMPIITPAVPDRAARLRFFLTNLHDEAVIDRAIAVTADLVRQATRLTFADFQHAAES